MVDTSCFFATDADQKGTGEAMGTELANMGAEARVWRVVFPALCTLQLKPVNHTWPQ